MYFLSGLSFLRIMQVLFPLFFLIFTCVPIVKKEFRSSETKLRMFDLALKKIKEHGCHYVFGLAMIQTCRSYRDDFAKLNYFLEIITNYPWRREDFFNFIDIFPIYSQFEAI